MSMSSGNWLILAQACDDCGGRIAAKLVDHEPSDAEKEECRRLLGGMYCIQVRVVGGVNVNGDALEFEENEQ